MNNECDCVGVQNHSALTPLLTYSHYNTERLAKMLDFTEVKPLCY